jgi:hypothetical protein
LHSILAGNNDLGVWGGNNGFMFGYPGIFYFVLRNGTIKGDGSVTLEINEKLMNILLYRRTPPPSPHCWHFWAWVEFSCGESLKRQTNNHLYQPNLKWAYIELLRLLNYLVILEKIL